MKHPNLDVLFKECTRDEFVGNFRLYPEDNGYRYWVYFIVNGKKYGYAVELYKGSIHLKEALADCEINKRKNTLIYFLNEYSNYNDIDATIENIIAWVDYHYDCWVGRRVPKKELKPK